MSNEFLNELIGNAADILTILLIVGVLAGGLLFWLKRRNHISALRNRLRGVLPLDGKAKEILGKVFNIETAEAGTIGTVTLVDLAWHYSMADPAIWDHFQGPAADHMIDAMQNLDILQSSLGDSAPALAENVIEYFKGLESTQVFHDVLDRLSAVDGADAGGIVLDAPADPVVDTLSDAATLVDAKASGLLLHVPLITIGFASYRAWRRSQQGAGLRRNAEFAAVEVATRASGGLVGGQIGGTIGTLIVPGVGTLIGGVAGAIAGAVGGALLGEEIKNRHIRKAQESLDESLEGLGKIYLQNPTNFRIMRDVFVEQERRYTQNLQETRRRMRRYGMLPWRMAWPDEKMILLQETVQLAQDRLGEIKQGTIDAVDRLEFMRETRQYRQLGIVLWSDPALCEQVNCDGEQIAVIAEANDTLRREFTQIGKQTAESLG